MSYTFYHAIVVTTYSLPYAQEANRVAVNIFQECVSPIQHSTVEFQHSFFIGPDGAKDHEGDRCPLADDPEYDCWTCQGDIRREKFIIWLDQQRFEDGSCPYTWVEVRYTNEDPTGVDHRTMVTAHSDQRKRRVSARQRWAANRRNEELQ